MAPALSAELAELVSYFKSTGLADRPADELVRSKPKDHTPIVDFFKLHKIESRKFDEGKAALALQAAKESVKLKLGEKEAEYVIEAIADGRLDIAARVTAATKFLSANPTPVDTAAFDKACGIGFSATDEEVESSVRSWISANSADVNKLAWKGEGKTLGQLKSTDELKWVNADLVKSLVVKVYTELFGDKEAAFAAGKAAMDKAAAEKKAQSQTKTQVAQPAKKEASEEDAYADLFRTGWLSRLHKPGGNEQKVPERMKEHLDFTKGNVYTRFPPEPNGFLHIGHSKAIAVNFGYAKYHKGHCYLRFDDTNPEAEEQIYFDKILEAVRWLGYEPFKITYSSDNFGKLYDLAVAMIERGLAYTSNDTAEDIKLQRGVVNGEKGGERHDSKDRNKPVEQVLQEFSDMKAGKYKPGEMTLRMKMDMTNPNSFMWDIIAYRVLAKPHHRTGSDWCIYPTYDFTHCLCDSIENISHSLCTTEFELAREAYNWVCDSLEVYRPQQREYGRLELEGTITSKRKLLRLVTEGHVSGWDDPRLYTIVALKRRGVPPEAIIAFVSSLGVSTSKTITELARFEQTVRSHLETTTPRLMMILDPLKVTLENLPEDYYEQVEKPLHPKDPSMGTNKLPFTRTVYIDQTDFRAEGGADFFRLAPGGTVGLLNVPFPITYVSHETDANGRVTGVVCKYESSLNPKPKTYIQWVAEHAPSNSPVRVKDTRLFSRLFKSDKPGALSGDDYIKDIDPASNKSYKGALLEVGVWGVIKAQQAAAKKRVEERIAEAKKNGTDAPPAVDGVESIRFQGLRVAYFALDLDSVLKEGEEEKSSELVLNQIAPLKEDKKK